MTISWVLLSLLLSISVSAINPENVDYIVGLVDKPQPLALPTQNGHIITMTSATGQKFDCFLPDPNNPIVEEVVEKPVESQKINILDFPGRAEEVLGKGCFVAARGYWSYEVCPFKSISQFHKEGKKIISTISLGEYVVRSPEEETFGGQYKQVFEGGDDGRKSMVRYVCNKQPASTNRKPHMVSDIQEPEMLEYEITFSSDLACNVSSGSTEQDAVLSLLTPFTGRCLYLSKGWWTYKLCFAQDVTQFHAEPQVIEGKKDKDGNPATQNVVTASFDLGKAISGQFETEIVDTGSWDTSYVVQTYTDGTVCDLTGQQRKTQVQYFCSPQDEYAIRHITETETCVYEMRVDTYHLCTHPVFTPEKPVIHDIVCAPQADPEVS